MHAGIGRADPCHDKAVWQIVKGSVRNGKDMGEMTIKDIAKRCGVGVGTVSRAINNHPDISQATKEMILDTIKATGFIPNNSARNLKRTDARCIAIIVKGITNFFFADMIRIFEQEIQKNEYAMVLRQVEAYEDEVECALELIQEKRLRGIIFLGGAFIHDELQLQKIKIPFIFSAIGLDETERGRKMAYSNIALDDREESCKLIHYLLKQGYHKIAIITEGTEKPSVGQLRLEGYRRAYAQAGIPVKENLIFYVDEAIEHYSMKNGYYTMQRILHSDTKFDAVFAISDAIAIGACRAIREAGLQIPQDVAVAGYDGIELGEYFMPRLTTIKQPVADMALQTIQLLLAVIEGKRKPEHIIFPGELVIKESTGKTYEQPGDQTL